MAGFQNVTLAQLRTQLQERAETTPWWSNDQFRRALNEGLRIWNVMTGTWRTQFSYTTLPFDPYVPMTGGVVKAIRVKFNGITLDPGSIEGFDFRIPNWEGTTTTTPGAPSRPLYWAPVSLTLLAIYPADQVGLNIILVDAISPAPILVNDGDFLNLGSEEINTLLGYALHVLSQSQGIAAVKATRQGYIDFLKAGALRNETLAASSFFRKALGLDRLRFAHPMQRREPGALDPTLPDQSQPPQAQGGA